MRLKPLHDRLVVPRIWVENTSAGGIIIPDRAQEKPVQGEEAAGTARIGCDGRFR